MIGLSEKHLWKTMCIVPVCEEQVNIIDFDINVYIVTFVCVSLCSDTDHSPHTLACECKV